MLMLALDLLQWWYLQGWGRFANGLINRIKGTFEFFSIGLLLRTLFSPYKQMFAEDHSTQGGIEAFFGALFDNLLSRIIGFFVRIGIIIITIAIVLIELLLGGIAVILWPVVPALPVIGVAFSIGGFLVGAILG